MRVIVKRGWKVHYFTSDEMGGSCTLCGFALGKDYKFVTDREVECKICLKMVEKRFGSKLRR